MNIIHIVHNRFSKDPRVLRAQSTWQHPMMEWQLEWYPMPYARNSTYMGDERCLPYGKDMLLHAMLGAKDSDVIVSTDDDVILLPKLDAELRRVMEKAPMATGQRIDIDSFDDRTVEFVPQSDHVGRCLCAFNVKWLRENFTNIPDFIAGASCADLAVSAWARMLMGKPFSMANVAEWQPACEVRPGYILHEKHESSWVGSQYTAPADKWNRKLCKNWFLQYMPDSLPGHLKDE